LKIHLLLWGPVEDCSLCVYLSNFIIWKKSEVNVYDVHLTLINPVNFNWFVHGKPRSNICYGRIKYCWCSHSNMVVNDKLSLRLSACLSWMIWRTIYWAWCGRETQRARSQILHLWEEK
jgi:hypothetical protein